MLFAVQNGYVFLFDKVIIQVIVHHFMQTKHTQYVYTTYIYMYMDSYTVNQQLWTLVPFVMLSSFAQLVILTWLQQSTGNPVLEVAGLEDGWMNGQTDGWTDG